MLSNKQKHLVLSMGVANAVATANNNVAAGSYTEGAEALFSMESLSSTSDYSKITNTLNSATSSVADLSAQITESLSTALLDVGMAEADPTEATVALASAIFGEGYIKSILGNDKHKPNYAAVEALMASATEAMATTGIVLGVGKSKSEVESYLNTLKNVQFSEEAQRNMIDGFDYGQKENWSLENFDKFDPNKDMVINMMLSALSVVEPPICRIAYPTYRLQPGQNVVTLYIDREFLLGNNYRNRGAAFKREDIPLLDAYWNTDLFGDDRTSCIPVYNDETKHLFVDPNLVGLKQKKDELGQEYKTGPLAFGKEVDFIAVSGARGEVKSRQQDRTDQLDPNFRLDTLTFKITPKAGDPVATEVAVNMYPTALRQQAQSGAVRKFQITFHENVLLGKPKNVKDGSEIAALEDIYQQYKQIVLRVTANLPEIDLTEASSLPSASATITGLRTADGKVVGIEDETVAALIDGLKIEPVGYQTDMRRTDTNFTNTGKELETRPERRPYPIGYAPRIQVRGPMGASDLEHAKLLDKGLVQITREKIVKQLEAKFNRLYPATDGGQGVVRDIKAFHSQAFGNVLVDPTLRFHKYKPDSTKTLSHAQRMADVRSHVVNTLRTLLAFTVDESRLRVVGKDFNKGSENIKIGMICDPKINQLLMVDGDNRLLTAAFDNFEIIEETAPFFKNRIVCVFHVDTPYEISPISNGFRAVGVSPVVKIDPDQTNGAKIQRIMTEPREVIVDTNEIMVVLEIENLDQLMDVNTETLNVTKNL